MCDIDESILNAVSPKYEWIKQLVAFIDIQGFSEAVEAIDGHWDVFDAPKRVFDTLKSIELMKAASSEVANVSMFSDSIVISFNSLEHNFEPTTKQSTVSYLAAMLKNLADISFNMLIKHGFLVRGGLTYGGLYHEGDVFFGPGLLKAIRIEESRPEPRIVIDEMLLGGETPDYICSRSRKQRKRNDVDYAAIYPFAGYSTIDGLWFVDFFDAQPTELLKKYQTEIREIVDWEKKRHSSDSEKDVKVRSKWGWIENMFEFTIRQRA
jgi:hypothetical protein